MTGQRVAVGWQPYESDDELPGESKQTVERRMDPSDGGYYTEAEFFQFYGTPAVWKRCKPEPHPAPPPTQPPEVQQTQQDKATEGGESVPYTTLEGLKDRRVDPRNGRAYTKEEFVAFYGGLQEWEEAGLRKEEEGEKEKEEEEEGEWELEEEYDESRPWACAYCKLSNPEAVVQCVATGKWFCNGVGGVGTSHAVVHMALSGHKALRFHDKSPYEGEPLVCSECEGDNAFVLGGVQSQGSYVLLCREGCLDSFLQKGQPVDAEWEPLVISKKHQILQPWLVPQPKATSAKRSGMKYELLRRLEHLWRTNPEATLADIDVSREDLMGTHVVYPSGAAYRDIMLPLLEAEAKAEQKICDESELSNTTVSWVVADGKAVGTFRYYLGESRLRVEAGDEVIVKGEEASWRTRVRHSTSTAEGEEVVVEVQAKNTTPPVSGKYTVKLEWNPVAYGRKRKAVEMFSEKSWACSKAVFHSLLGKDRGDDSEHNVDLQQAPNAPELNHSQKRAVKAALQRPVCLVQGPPGTGKTTVLVSITYNLLASFPRVLACAPSNIAADNLAKALKRTGTTVLRLSSKSREAEASQCEELTLHYQVEHLLKTAPRTALLIQRREAGEKLTADDEQVVADTARSIALNMLDKAEVIVTTCINAADPRLRSMKFPAVVLDEATQATEPEILIPVVKGAEKVVLVGDHCQLGPIVMCKEAAKQGFAKSMFERMVDSGMVPVRLVVQYRMHPNLSRWPSANFYDGSLQNGVLEADRKPTTAFPWPSRTHPMCFRHVSAAEELGSSGTSFINREEARVLEETALQLLNGGVHPAAIGIITPYEGQRLYVTHLFQRNATLNNVLNELEIKSVDSFQGREKEYVLISYVRSNEADKLGFLVDPRRLNVSLTRARRGLVITGNAKVLAKNKLWHGLLTYMQEMGTVTQGGLEHMTLYQDELPFPTECREEERRGWTAAQSAAPPPPTQDTWSYVTDLISQVPDDTTLVSAPPSLLSSYAFQSSLD